MHLLCRLLGHNVHGRQMDTDFKEYSRCNRCGSALERVPAGKWKLAETALPDSPPSSAPPR